MVIENSVAAANAAGGANGNNAAHPSGIPQDKIDNIMSGIANTGDVKMNNHRKKLRQRFDIIKKLGQGTYGKVQLGINKETGQEVAIKTIKKCKIEAEADLVRIRREVQIMSSVQHPNIIHIYEVFENREKMVLVMEFAAGGELYDYLSERKVLSEEEARRIFRQVSTAVYYCHKHKICHRDLKLENILLDEHGNAKIADFGLSNVFDDQHLLGTFCGSPLYASPEIVEGTPYWGPEVDCWSLGVLLYTLVYGSMPFDGSNFKRLVKQISQGDYYEPKKPSRASTLIREMLTVSPQKRATIEQICAHWWVNENDNVSCLELAENLANQTPVRLDVLLSLTPAAVVAEQLVVPSSDGGGAVASKVGNAAMPRSHSVGSIRDMSAANATTEAEQRILDMVAAGGEAALMPSPTRTITPAASPVQTKRKLETTVSMENAAALKKKEKAGSSSMVIDESTLPLTEEEPMDTEDAIVEEPPTPAAMQHTSSANFSHKDMELIDNMCVQLMQDKDKETTTTTTAPSPNENVIGTASSAPPPVINTSSRQQKTVAAKLDAVEESPEEKEAAKTIKKFVNKHKTVDLVNAIGQAMPSDKINEAPTKRTTTASKSPTKAAAAATPPTIAPFVRKCSLQDESALSKFNADRRKSRILETAEKFQQMNANAPAAGASNAPSNIAAEKPKKIVIPGVSVGSFKKEFERKASNATVLPQGPTAGERRAMEQAAAAAAEAAEREVSPQDSEDQQQQPLSSAASQETSEEIENSDSKNSVHSLSLDDARRSMENSIALLRQAQNETTKDVDQLCAKTESIGVSEPKINIAAADRERKLQNARAIIGSAIQPASPDPNNGAVKTSTASITLKSATLPRRKTAKTEIQLDIKPRIMEQQPEMHFTTEMQHPIADLRSAPPRDGPVPYSPVKTTTNARATSLEPKEHIIRVQRPPQAAYSRTTSNSSNRSGSLSRQSTNDSESETTTNLSQSTMTASSQPIKKSPREFIIPIAVEGGGFITPREGSIEPSESSHTASSRSTFNRFNQRPARRIGSLLSDAGTDDSPSGLHFQKMRTGPISRDADDDDHFTLHRLRSSRPVKKVSQDNDSNSSGEEDDDDGFEILTAENLFSTLLQRVRALTNRLNVNNDLTSGFPNSSRLLTSMRHDRGPFWNEEPFTSRLNNSSKGINSGGSGIGSGAPWRHSMSRDLGSDMDSMFSRTGATLPRGSGSKSHKKPIQIRSVEQEVAKEKSEDTIDVSRESNLATNEEPLDLADLDLSRLRLSKKELETLSNIAPGLPKCFQEQLIAKLPPTQARKLSRTLSMQNEPLASKVKIYKRSQSGGRKTLTDGASNIGECCSVLPEENESSPAKATNSQNLQSTTTEQSNSAMQLPHRSGLNRTRFDCESSIPTPLVLDTSTGANIARKSRSNSVCRDDYSNSLCSSYTSDVSDKYKYYSPYLSKSTRETTTTPSSADSGSVSPYKRYSSISPRETSTSAVVGRPPSGCLSPLLPVATGGEAGNNSSLRRRTAQRRLSRFLRPDFYEEQPIAGDETPYQREKKQRERETQSVLREIREKTRDSSRERANDLNLNQENTTNVIRKHSVIGSEAELLDQNHGNRHVRNKSLELFDEQSTTRDIPRSDSPTKRHRRSLSRTRKSEELDTHALADKILQELQLLSEIRSEKEKKQEDPDPREVSPDPKTTDTKTVGVTDKDETVAEKKVVIVKKIKKIRPKEKATDVGSETIETKPTTTTSSLKKVKKIIKKGDSVKVLQTELPPSNGKDGVEQPIISEALKESKLKRPKSYPTKELALRSEMPTKTLPQPVARHEVQCDVATCPQSQQQYTANTIESAPYEGCLIRPKSYPASKLSAPKDIKKIVTRSGVAVPTIAESNIPVLEAVSQLASNSRHSTIEDKSQSVTPTGKSSRDTSSSSESRPTIKKVIKVTKKSKLVQPTAITPTTPMPASSALAMPAITTPTTVAPTLVAESRRESKEKSPDKKPGKGLLYAIGQKFERFRDSALNKEKKALINSASSITPTLTNTSTPQNNVVEKTEKKTSLLKKKKSHDDGDTSTTPKLTAKTDKAAKGMIIEKNETETPSGNKAIGKPEKRSRFDAMIRSLRERSLPRAPPTTTESSYIKRAVSVEDMPRSLNSNAVNRVLGLFKRSEKEGSAERRVRSTRSTSNIERQLCETPTVASPIYQNTKEAREAAEAEEIEHDNCNCDVVTAPQALTCPECIAQRQINDIAIKRREPRENSLAVTIEEQTTPNGPTKTLKTIHHQSNKDKRKGLMLDLVKVDGVGAYMPYSSNTSTGTTTTRNSRASYINGNGGSSLIANGYVYSNLPPYPCTIPNSSSNPSSSQHSMENNTNNNSCTTNNNNNNSSSMQTSQTSGYRTSSTHEINRNNPLSPSSENIANYSSDCSRSYQDDCASNSTFISPTDEPELYFDNWSVCSEDNYMLHATPSPTVSRLSRASQLSSPTRVGSAGGGGDSSDPNESVIDRIKRRSFYTRFNEKKPKRTSSIVGPTAVRDYYREQKAAIKAARSAHTSNVANGIERKKSPDITQEFMRPLKLSPIGTELKPPVYKSPYNDYTSTNSTLMKPRKSLNDIRTIATPSYLASKHRYGALSNEHQNDYLTVPTAASTASRFKSSSSPSPYKDGPITTIGSGTTSASGYYSTYNPKRRSSYTLNGLLPTATATAGTGKGSANIDSYATLGRRTGRLPNQRTMSMLDPTTTTSTSYRRDSRTPVPDYTTALARSDSRYRTTSRSPTNI